MWGCEEMVLKFGLHFYFWYKFSFCCSLCEVKTYLMGKIDWSNLVRQNISIAWLQEEVS